MSEIWQYTRFYYKTRKRIGWDQEKSDMKNDSIQGTTTRGQKTWWNQEEFVCLLLNGTSAQYRLLGSGIVDTKQIRYVKTDLKQTSCKIDLILKSSTYMHIADVDTFNDQKEYANSNKLSLNDWTSGTNKNLNVTIKSSFLDKMNYWMWGDFLKQFNSDKVTHALHSSLHK